MMARKHYEPEPEKERILHVFSFLCRIQLKHNLASGWRILSRTTKAQNKWYWPTYDVVVLRNKRWDEWREKKDYEAKIQEGLWRQRVADAEAGKEPPPLIL